MRRLNGKVAIITGAAMGQGKAEAILFGREGAKVIATDVQEEQLQEVIDEIRANDGEAIGMKHDVSLESDWKQVIKKTIESFGRLDILVNNAGIAGKSFKLEKNTLEEWDKVMAVNATSVFLGLKYAVPEMKKNSGGSIINISSVAGIAGAGTSPYSASKGAIRILSKSAAVDYAKDNIRVNSVHPGFIETPMTRKLDEKSKRFKNYFLEKTPLKKAGLPEDVAYGVLYLASDESSFVTGTELIIDGGYIAN